MSGALFRLDGKRALVTGASSGLGLHFADVLAAAGATVVMAARRTDKLEAAAARTRRHGGIVHCVALDVTDQASVREAFSAMPLPDVVINNAGINVEGPSTELSEAQWDQVMHTNVRGAFSASCEAIRRWIAQERPGNIINVASILGLRAQRQLAAYSASKAALIQLTRSFAIDYARHRIRANALCPGYCVTDINREWLASDSGKRLLDRIPFRRAAEASELDGALLLLASDASTYMTGSTLVVDGGHSQNTL